MKKNIPPKPKLEPRSKPKPKPDVSALIQSALHPPKTTGPMCWAQRLRKTSKDVRLLEFMDAIDGCIREEKPLSRAQTGRILRDEFGLPFGPESIRHHLARTCRCWRI